jgi:osmotically-inducible protein OsmY
MKKTLATSLLLAARPWCQCCRAASRWSPPARRKQRCPPSIAARSARKPKTKPSNGKRQETSARKAAAVAHQLHQLQPQGADYRRGASEADQGRSRTAGRRHTTGQGRLQRTRRPANFARDAQQRLLHHHQGQGTPGRLGRVQRRHVKVVTENGVVYLLGLVTQREADAAIQVARTTSDVKKVVTLLEIITDAEAKELDGQAGAAASEAR